MQLKKLREKNDVQSEVDLPVKHNLKLVYALSLIISGLMTLASVTGILFPSIIYPTDELTATFISNDVINLLIGLPIILISIILSMKKTFLVCCFGQEQYSMCFIIT